MEDPKKKKPFVKNIIEISILIVLVLVSFILGYFFPKYTPLAPSGPYHGHLIAYPFPKQMPTVEQEQDNSKDVSFGTIKTPNGEYEIMGLKN